MTRFRGVNLNLHRRGQSIRTISSGFHFFFLHPHYRTIIFTWKSLSRGRMQSLLTDPKSALFLLIEFIHGAYVARVRANYESFR